MQKRRTSLKRVNIEHTIKFPLEHLNGKTRARNKGPPCVLTTQENEAIVAWI
jgi:hypothetical protein